MLRVSRPRLGLLLFDFKVEAFISDHLEITSLPSASGIAYGCSLDSGGPQWGRGPGSILVRLIREAKDSRILLSQ